MGHHPAVPAALIGIVCTAMLSAQDARLVTHNFGYTALPCQDLVADQVITVAWPATSSPQTIRTDKGTLFERPRPDVDAWVHEDTVQWSLTYYELIIVRYFLRNDGTCCNSTQTDSRQTAITYTFRAPNKGKYCFLVTAYGTYPESKNPTMRLNPPGPLKFRKAE